MAARFEILPHPTSTVPLSRRGGGRCLRTEVRQVDRLLHVQLPVDEADERFHVTLRAEHDCWRHRAARPLAGLDAVRHGAPLGVGR
jgi:hypothetical protein